MKKTYILSIILSLICAAYSHQISAQYLAPRLSIHLSNPLSLLSKAGVKAQYRVNQENSFLMGYRWYWGFFPGYQASAEYHHYFRSFEKSEAFFYGKLGFGNATYEPKPYFSGWETKYNNPGGYAFAAAGLGKRYNFGPFFIEGNAGLRFSQLVEKTENYNRNLFYTTGPGSFMDVSLNFGFQFFNEERNMYRKTLGVHPPRRYR